MRIYIPTRGRAPSEQYTWNALGEEVRAEYPTTLLVETQEEADTLSNFTVQVTGARGIVGARRWVVDNSPDNKVIMLDDDLKGWAARTPEGKYIKGTSHNILLAMHEVDHLLDTYAHSGIGFRQFANNKPLVDFNTKAMRALAYRVDIIRREGINFTMPLMQDFEMTLELLTRGYDNAIYYGVVQDQSASHTKGGCSAFRTVELMEKCARELQQRFPHCVKLRKADGWGLGERTDVSVQWKKAAEYGQ